MRLRQENSKHTYMLRTCNEDMSSHNNFVWPASGKVECSDWDPEPRCGGGLHGLLRGEGNAWLLNHSESAKWLVVKVSRADVVEIDGKVKVPKGEVVFVGGRDDAVKLMQRLCPGAAVVFGTATAGDGGTAAAGDGGTAAAGDGGTAAAGHRGTATAGDGGTATAGDGGTATAGDYGTATAGYRGTATAGDDGEIRLRYWDSKADRYRTKVGYIGEDGLKPDTPYQLNDKLEFIEKT